MQYCKHFFGCEHFSVADQAHLASIVKLWDQSTELNTVDCGRDIEVKHRPKEQRLISEYEIEQRYVVILV